MKKLASILLASLLALCARAQLTPVQPQPTSQALMTAAAATPSTADNTTFVTPFALYNYYSAQSATGPYSPTSFTANNILTGGGVGAIQASGATVTNSGNTLTFAGGSTLIDSGTGVLDTFSGRLNVAGTTSASSAITGTLTVGNGTAATNVGVGAGNVNVGATLTAVNGAFTSVSAVASPVSAPFVVAGGAGFNGQMMVEFNVVAAFGNNSWGALPSGANIIGNAFQSNAVTNLYTGTNTATTAQAVYLGAPIYSNASAGTITDAFNENAQGPAAAALSQVITRPHTLGVHDSTSASSAITGGLVVAATYGTAATSTGIGGGNVNTGGSITTGGALSVGTTVTSYNGVATAGNGVDVVVAAPRQTALTNALATLATYTVPAADSSFIITANVQVTATTAAAMTVVCTYTDETNTSRAQTIPFCQLAGTFLTSITNATGVGPYEGASLHIRCKASTTIVFTTAGTVTGITYNIQGTVIQTG